MMTWLASAGLFAGGIEIAGMEDPIEIRTEISTPLSVETIRHIAQDELGMTPFQLYPKRQTQEGECEASAPSLTQVISDKTIHQLQQLCNDPRNTLEEDCRIMAAAVDWAAHYRLSREQVKETDPKKLDCNDNDACEILSQYRVPMYLVSIWPKQPGHRLDHSWHQFAVCKLKDKKYVIFDGKMICIWNDTLQNYVKEQSSAVVEMEILPIGLSKYVRPYFDNPVSKGIVQLRHVIQSEQDMIPYHAENEHPLIASQQINQEALPKAKN